MHSFWKKILSVLVVMMMLVSSIPPSVLAETTQGNKEKKKKEENSLSEWKELEKIEGFDNQLLDDLEPGGEIVEKRTEMSKFFYNGDGSIVEKRYFQPIHKKDKKNSRFEEISPELVEDTVKTKTKTENSKEKQEEVAGNIEDEVVLKTQNTTLQSNFLKKMKKGKYATFDIGGHSISYSLLEAFGDERPTIQPKNQKAVFEENQVTYEEVFPNIDLRNISFNTQTKEDIILHSYDGYNAFSFHIETDLRGELTDVGSLEFFDFNNNKVFMVPKPFMTDSNYDEHKGQSERSDNVKYEMKKNETGYTLTIKADVEWLADPMRQFPVYIDPSIETLDISQDTFVMSAYPTTNYNGDGKWNSEEKIYQLQVGYYDSSTGRNYAYIKPETANMTPEAGYMVSSAKFKVYVTHHYYVNNPNGLWLDYVNNPWDAGTLTWNNKPSSTTKIGSVSVGRGQWAEFDVSGIVKEWNKGNKTNYGFRIHTNGNGTSHWKRIISASNATNRPYLEITYTTLGTAKTPVAKAYSNGTNSITGYVDLSWDKVEGADGYKVAIFNGATYEYVDVGDVTKWSTKGKRIWPTPKEIEADGRYGLHIKDGKTDGTGAELPNDPRTTYIASGGSHKGDQNYWFRVIAYNKEYGVETVQSLPAKPVLPDNTPPNNVSKPTVKITDGSINSGNNATAIVSWNAVQDLPKDMGAGINYYELQKKVNGSWSSVKNVKHSGESNYQDTITDLPDDTTVSFRVRAFDNKGNYSGYSTSSEYMTLDRTPPSTPTSVSVTPTTWSSESEYVVSWEGITDNAYLESIQYKVGDQSWKGIGSNSEEGSMPIPVDFTDGIHTIQIRGLDRAGNKGVPRTANVMKDTVAPTVWFEYPKPNETVKGIEEIKIGVENPVGHAEPFNLIHNGDFQYGLDGWSEMKAKDNGTTSTEGEANLDQTLSISMSTDSSSPSNELGYIAATYELEVKPNTTYKLEGKVKTFFISLANAFFNVQMQKEDGTHISWNDNRYLGLSGTRDWYDSELIFTTPNETGKIIIYLQIDHQGPSSQGEAWFDSISLRELNEETGGYSPNFIENGDFSNGLDGWNEVRVFDTGRISIDEVSVEPFHGFEETMTLQLDSSSSSSGTELGYLSSTYEVGVKPNTNYRLSGLIKTDLQQANAFFNVKMMETDGTHLDWADSRSQQLTGKNGWMDQELMFTTSEGVEKVRLYLQVDHRDSGAKGTAWFDSIKLEEVNQNQEVEIGQYNWSLVYGEGENPSDYTRLNSGTSSSDEVIYNWDTSILKNEKVYTLKFTATDEAGNTTTNTSKIIKTKDTTSIEPAIKIINPKDHQEINDEYHAVEYSVDKVSSFSRNNLIMNGNFDYTFLDRRYNEQPDGWMFNIINGPGVTSAVTDASNGRISILSFESFQTNEWSWGGSAFYSQKVKINPNTIYQIKGDMIDELDDLKGDIYIDLYNDDQFLESIDVMSDSPINLNIHQWQTYKKVFTSPNEANNAVIRLNVSGDFKSERTMLAFDNIQLSTGMLDFERMELFVNSKRHDYKYNDSNYPLYIETTEYPEGSNNQFYLRGLDSSGSYSYSTYSYRTRGVMDQFENEEFIDTLSGTEHTGNRISLLPSSKKGYIESTSLTFPGSISTIHLSPSEEKPSGTSITYEASSDGGNTWDEIEPNKMEAISHTGMELKVRAILSSSTTGVSPTLNAWESEIVYVNTQGNTFEVKLIDEPKNLTATPNVNYMTLLRWDASSTEGVSYSVHRSSTPNFTPTNKTLLVKGVKDSYWNDYNLNYGQEFYYKVVAVKEFNGQARESVSSNEAWSKVVEKNEVEKRLGLQDYWGYSSFPTARGKGYVNISSGNLVYQSTDFVTISPQLAMVMRRSFNSQSTTKTPLGYGWDFSFNTTLLKEYDASGTELGLILKDGDGSLHRFTKKSDGTYNTPKGVHMTLTKRSDGQYEILRKDQVKYVFDSQMKLKKMTEPNGNELTFEYDRNRGNLVFVRNNVGDQTEIVYYDDQDLVKEVIDSAGRTYKFLYENERLTETFQIVEQNHKYVEKYQYNEDKSELRGIVDSKEYETKLQFDGDKLKKVTDPIGESSSFDYTEINGTKMTTITTDKGKTVSFTYNANGNVTSKMNADNHQVHYDYTDDMLVNHMYYDNTIDGEKKTLHHWYTYDNRGNIETIKDPLGNVTEFNDYNDMNLLGEILEPIRGTAKASTTFKYDERGNLKTSRDAEGRTVSYTYDDFGNQETVTNEFNQTTTYEYDKKGRLMKILEPLGKVTQVLEYDKQGNATKIKDSRGYITENQYDLLDRLIKSIDPKGHTVTQSFDLNHNLIDRTNNRGFTTEFQYDEVGRLKTTIHPNGDVDVVNYDFDENNNEKIVYTDGEGRTNTQYYNEVGQLYKEAAFNAVTEYYYDEVGNMSKAIDGEGRVVQSVYDELDRQTKVIVDPNGKNIVTENVYDLQGNVLKTIDGEGYTKDYQFDRVNRLKQVTQTVDGKPQTTSYDYDQVEGDFVKNKVTDALGRQKWTYLDALGRVRKEVDEGDTSDSERLIQTFEYDLNDNMTESTRNDGTTVEQQYDGRNQVKKAIYGDGHYTVYQYDANGNREYIHDTKDGKTIASSYAYDNKDRLMQVVQDGITVNYEYDSSDNLTKFYYPTEDGDGQKDIDYIFDGYNRLESIMVEEKKVQELKYTNAAKLDYAKNYLEFDTNGSNYVKIDYQYDSTGRTNTIQYLKQGTMKLEEYVMKHDNRGYIENETIYTNYNEAKTVRKSYEYNEVGQLKVSTIDQKSTSYEYDEVGNRKIMDDGQDSYSYSYNQFNQLKSTMKNGQSHASYEYDNRGNQQIEIIKKEIDGAMKDVTTNYSYDLANQLTAVETITPGKETTTLKNVYNGDGQRIRRDANGLVTKYLYHDDAILYTTDNNNRKTTENILNPTGMIVASKRFEGGHANNHFFYQYDIRGSVTNVVDSDAKRVKGYEYDDFGKPKEVGDKTFENDVKFTGAVHDASTGLHYMNARYYNSDTGRFLSQDTYSGSPNDPWTQHLYTYTSNNPVNYTDPTGHYAVNVEGTQRQLPTGRIITEPKPSNTISPGSQDRPTTKSSTKKATSSESKKSSFFGSLQKGLDFLGNAPGPIGAVADGINALAYAAQGDFKNAALSGVAVLPGGSLVKNGIKAGRGIRSAAKGTGDLVRGTNKRGQVTGRGGFRKSTVHNAWDNAKDGPKGGKLCPTCEKEIFVPPFSGKKRDWDVDHTPAWTNRTFLNPTRKEVLDDYQKGTRLECPSCNRRRGNRE
ncbi:DNRLRE domain-containing protein [Bacillus sp. 2205SS5-2]|uniref:DNRLRE domain-containing protein n=1 Tax=Bacillus sp. 2205SS5-2 TaxID=3109031 RepID=UPI003006F558